MSSAQDMTKLAGRVAALENAPEHIRWRVREPKGGRTFVCANAHGEIVVLSKTAGKNIKTHTNAERRLRNAGFFDDEEKYKALQADGARQRTESVRAAAEAKIAQANREAASAAAPTRTQEATPPATPPGQPFTPQSVMAQLLGGGGPPKPNGGPPPEPVTDHADVDHDGMVTRTEWFDYNRALELLTRPAPILDNGQPLKQRPRSGSHVRWLADIMRRPGAWTVTAQGIALPWDQPDEHDVLTPRSALDGQHRLLAIVDVAERGATIILDGGETVEIPPRPDIRIQMRVTYNVDPNTFADYDHGLGRTAAHSLHSMGYTDSNHLASAGKLWWCVRGHLANPTGPLAIPAYWDRSKPTDRQITDILADKDLLVPHVSVGSAVAKGAKGIPAAAIVFRVLAMRQWPEGVDRLNEFCQEVKTGANLDTGNPAKTLREWMLAGTGKTVAGPKRVKQLIGWIAAWNRWVAGTELRGMAVDPRMPLKMPVSPRPKPIRPVGRRAATAAPVTVVGAEK